MKKFSVFSATLPVCALAIMLAFSLAFMSCGDPGDGNQGGETSATYETTKDGTTYKLTVTKSVNKAAYYAPAKGDTYVLLIITGTETKTSRGTVYSISNSVFTLKPANATATFTITISGNIIVIINGPIALEGSGGTVQGPGDLGLSNPVNPSNPANPANPANPGNNGDFDYVINGGSVTITGYKGSGGNVAIPAAIEGMPVTEIGSMAFVGHISLSPSPITSVTIPDSVITIGGSAFWMCDSLTSVTIGSGVTSIGKSAFWMCDSLTSVTIGSGVTSIGYGAFWGCDSLPSVTIPNSVTSIGEVAFFNCTSLTRVTIGSSVTSIGSGAFWGCNSLASVIIPDSVTSIGSSAFLGCTSLASVSIGNSVTSIGEMAFNGCKNLTSVTIPDSVTRIGNSSNSGVFVGCTNLTSVTFQGTISWGYWYWAFDGDLCYKFYATDKDKGTPGTYTTKAPVNNSSEWTKQ